MQESTVTGTILLVRPMKLPCKREVTLENQEFADIIDGNLEIVKLKKRKVALQFEMSNLFCKCSNLQKII